MTKNEFIRIRCSFLHLDISDIKAKAQLNYCLRERIALTILSFYQSTKMKPHASKNTTNLNNSSLKKKKNNNNQTHPFNQRPTQTRGNTKHNLRIQLDCHLHFRAIHLSIFLRNISALIKLLKSSVHLQV